jgi:hypothetical protein
MSGHPSPNVGAGVEFAIALSGAGITGESGEYTLKAAFQSTVVVTANVVDLNGIAIASQPALTAVSFNGPATQAGEASSPVTLVSPNSAGAEFARAPNPIGGKDVTGIGQTSNIASVSAVAGDGTATVTITGVGRALLEWRTPRGTTARLNITAVQA